jgi:hypothetical protein
MNKQNKFKKFISKIFHSRQEKFELAVENNDVIKVKLLLKKMFVNPSIYNNQAIEISSKNGYTDIVELLLKDKRVNPTEDNNYAIIGAFKNKQNNVVTLLWNDQRVKDTLKKSDTKIYNEMIAQEIKNKIGKF